MRNGARLEIRPAWRHHRHILDADRLGTIVGVDAPYSASDGGLDPRANCNYDAMVTCATGVGFTCDNQAGDTPEGDFPGVTCTVASSADGTFCCTAK